MPKMNITNTGLQAGRGLDLGMPTRSSQYIVVRTSPQCSESPSEPERNNGPVGPACQKGFSELPEQGRWFDSPRRSMNVVKHNTA